MPMCLRVPSCQSVLGGDAVNLVLPLVASTWKNRHLCSPPVMQKGDTTEKMETHWPHSVQPTQNNNDEEHDISLAPDAFFHHLISTMLANLKLQNCHKHDQTYTALQWQYTHSEIQAFSGNSGQLEKIKWLIDLKYGSLYGIINYLKHLKPILSITNPF